MGTGLTIVDAWAALAAATAGAFLALRSNMLKPGFAAWCDASAPVRLSLFILSVIMGGAVVSIVRGGGATPREAVWYSALAVVSVVMFANLVAQARARSPEKSPLTAVDLETARADPLRFNAALQAEYRASRGYPPERPPMTPLSPHFTLEELTASQTAARRGISNVPPATIVENLRQTAAHMEKVRAALGNRAISVSSGYRSPRLNAEIGGAKNSAHVFGHAVDFNCFSFGSPLDVCRALVAAGVEFDQLIEEGTWVHIAFTRPMRRQVLTKNPAGGYLPGLRD